MTFPDYLSDTEVDNTTYLLTSLPEMHRIFSKRGVDMHVDDINESDDNYDENNIPDVSVSNYYEEQIQRSTSWVMARLAPRYSVVDVYRNPRLREMATYHACHQVTRRRGNEPVYEAEVAEALDELEDYRDGRLYLDAPSNGNRAYFQSGVVDLRFARYQWRVNQDASSNVRPGQHLLFRAAFFWL